VLIREDKEIKRLLIGVDKDKKNGVDPQLGRKSGEGETDKQRTNARPISEIPIIIMADLKGLTTYIPEDPWDTIE
jgi:hypothetical protein